MHEQMNLDQYNSLARLYHLRKEVKLARDNTISLTKWFLSGLPLFIGFIIMEWSLPIYFGATFLGCCFYIALLSAVAWVVSKRQLKNHVIS